MVICALGGLLKLLLHEVLRCRNSKSCNRSQGQNGSSLVTEITFLFYPIVEPIEPLMPL